MNLEEVINNELERLHSYQKEDGMWNGEDFSKMLYSLYLALAELAKQKGMSSNG